MFAYIYCAPMFESQFKCNCMIVSEMFSNIRCLERLHSTSKWRTRMFLQQMLMFAFKLKSQGGAIQSFGIFGIFVMLGIFEIFGVDFQTAHSCSCSRC